MEIGIGFLVSCVPRSAWILDKFSVNALGPLFSKLRSFTSATSFSGRSTSKVDQTSRTWETKAKGADHSQRDLVSVVPPKSSYSQPSFDDIQMAVMPEQNGRCENEVQASWGSRNLGWDIART